MFFTNHPSLLIILFFFSLCIHIYLRKKVLYIVWKLNKSIYDFFIPHLSIVVLSCLFLFLFFFFFFFFFFWKISLQTNTQRLCSYDFCCLLFEDFHFVLKKNMPSEIITLQLGQCGNQSEWCSTNEN